MRRGRLGVLSIGSRLLSQVNNTPPYNRIGVETEFISSRDWSEINNVIGIKNASLVEVNEMVNFIRQPHDRPLHINNSINLHELKYSDTTWKEKVKSITECIRTRKANAYLVAALDDIAWLLKVHGFVVPYNPFFKINYIINTLFFA